MKKKTLTLVICILIGAGSLEYFGYQFLVSQSQMEWKYWNMQWQVSFNRLDKV